MSHCSKCGLAITSEYQYAHEKLCGGPLVAKDDMAFRIAAWNAEKLQDSEAYCPTCGQLWPVPKEQP